MTDDRKKANYVLIANVLFFCIITALFVITRSPYVLYGVFGIMILGFSIVLIIALLRIKNGSLPNTPIAQFATEKYKKAHLKLILSFAAIGIFLELYFWAVDSKLYLVINPLFFILSFAIMTLDYKRRIGKVIPTERVFRNLPEKYTGMAKDAAIASAELKTNVIISGYASSIEIETALSAEGLPFTKIEDHNHFSKDNIKPIIKDLPRILIVPSELLAEIVRSYRSYMPAAFNLHIYLAEHSRILDDDFLLISKLWKADDYSGSGKYQTGFKLLSRFYVALDEQILTYARGPGLDSCNEALKDHSLQYVDCSSIQSDISKAQRREARKEVVKIDGCLITTLIAAGAFLFLFGFGAWYGSRIGNKDTAKNKLAEQIRKDDFIPLLKNSDIDFRIRSSLIGSLKNMGQPGKAALSEVLMFLKQKDNPTKDDIALIAQINKALEYFPNL
jgi:hypothetical protein